MHKIDQMLESSPDYRWYVTGFMPERPNSTLVYHAGETVELQGIPDAAELTLRAVLSIDKGREHLYGRLYRLVAVEE